MGGVIAKLAFKNGEEKAETEHKTAWTIGCDDIDGKKVPELGQVVPGKRAIVVTNSARN